MKSKRTLVIGALAVAATFSVGIASASFFGFQLPEFFAQQAPKAGSTTGSLTSGQRISGSVNNVSVQQAIDWLKDKGISFVIDMTKVGKDRRVTFNLKDVDESEAVRAVARGLGLGVTREGKTYVLVEGGSMTPFAPSAGLAVPGSKGMATPPSLYFKSLDPSDPEFEKNMKDLQDRIKVEVEKLGDGKMNTFMFSEKEQKELREVMKKLELKMKEGGAMFELDTSKLMKELEKEGAFSFRFQPRKIEDVLTAAQKERLEAGKELTEKDFTAEELKKMGLHPDSKISIKKAGTGGYSITITRGEKPAKTSITDQPEQTTIIF